MSGDETCSGTGAQPADGLPGRFGTCPDCNTRIYIRLDGTVSKHVPSRKESHPMTADVTREPTGGQELREAIARALWERMPDEPYQSDADAAADAVLALPEVAALIADGERVRRVREEVDAWGDASREWYYAHRFDADGTTYACGFEDGWNHAEECIGRALDGEDR